MGTYQTDIRQTFLILPLRIAKLAGLAAYIPFVDAAGESRERAFASLQFLMLLTAQAMESLPSHTPSGRGKIRSSQLLWPTSTASQARRVPLSLLML